MAGLVRPAKVALKDARVREETEDGGFKVGIVIDRVSHGSPLLLGLEWIEPGTEAVSWHANENTHETYYVVRGQVQVSWDGRDAGTEVVRAEDSFYFPPGRRYTAETIGDEQAFIIWALTPSPPQ
jgi:mannose-6-phosphate isomerase-like protein (cupin superfamily)